MKNYNMLLHYANFRKAVVSDLPEDIYLNELKLNDEQKELILNGLPLLKDFIISIYDNVIEFANTSSLTQKEFLKCEDNSKIMNARRDARNYMDKVFFVSCCN